MEESKPVPCSEQHAQRFCCAILKRHTVVSIIPNAFRRFVLRHVESSIPEIEALRPALTTACIQYFEKHFFFRILFKIDCLSDFCFTKSTLHSLFTEPIFSVACVTSPQKESGLGWVCTKWLAPQLCHWVRTIRNHIDNWDIAKTGHYWTAQGKLVTVHRV